MQLNILHRAKQKRFISPSCFSCFISILIIVLAGNVNAAINKLSAQQLQAQINQMIPDNELNIRASREVIAKINQILRSQSEQDDLHATFLRLKKYQVIIMTALKNKGMPADLIVLPVVESQYQQTRIKNDSQQPAGIWQMVPSTARKYGLVVTRKRDDRLNPQLETIAALNYLKELYSEFNDWRLALVAYELGDAEAAHLIKKVHSHNSWVLARSPSAPAILKHHLTLIDTDVIILHAPTFVSH